MDLESFRGLLTPAGAALLAEVVTTGVDGDDAALALGSRLRKDHPPELVAAAITQARLRARAAAKFGTAAADMWFTPAGLEQSTRADVAVHRARRFADATDARVVDLCCGIGADLRALAAAGADVTGVESDPLTAAVAAANLAAEPRARVVLGDAVAHDLDGATAVFCDPSRRTGRGRVFDPAGYSPPWSFVRHLLTGDPARGVAVKVAPGIPHDLAPAGVEIEWVSVRGEVKEAGLYSGALATGVRRRATLLPGGHTLSADGPDTDEVPPPVGPPLRYLYEPDGAVVRSHLVGAVVGLLDGRLLDATIAYVTADALVATPFATAYEVTDVLPFSVKALRALLRERGVGRLTVKKRGTAVTPEALRRQLDLRGDAEATVVLTRCAGVQTVLVVRPVGPAETPLGTPPGLTRRGLVTRGAVAGAGAVLAPGLLRRPAADPPPELEPLTDTLARLTPTPFTLGVASGEPRADGVVLWTRLAFNPLALDGSGGMPPDDVDVEWQLAEDAAFRQVVRSGTEVARARDGHSVHVDLTGLSPGRDYTYRFRSGGHLSPVGRTRTAPPAGARTPVHVAVASCANYEHGWYTAYRRLAESAPDVVVHLGDYLYEWGEGSEEVSGGVVRSHVGPRTTDLATYRLRHAQYKTDPDLQAAHAAAPWIVSFDDHDVLDNWAGTTPALPADAPAFPAIRAAAWQAYWENMPLRPASRPRDGRMQMYRRLPWGRVASFHVLDTRQYRDPQACRPGYSKKCKARYNVDRTMLGSRQEAWLTDGLRSSSAIWDVLAQQVFFTPNVLPRLPRPKDDGIDGWNMDTWDGYVPARERVLAAVRAAGNRNLVVLSGDVHSAWAADIVTDFSRPELGRLGVELVTTSISSGGDGDDTTEWGRRALEIQPHLKFFNRRRGWVAVRVDADRLTADFRALPYVRQPGAPDRSAGTFVVEAGRPGLHAL